MAGLCEIQFVCGGGPICKSMRGIQHRGVTASPIWLSPPNTARARCGHGLHPCISSPQPGMMLGGTMGSGYAGGGQYGGSYAAGGAGGGAMAGGGAYGSGIQVTGPRGGAVTAGRAGYGAGVGMAGGAGASAGDCAGSCGGLETACCEAEGAVTNTNWVYAGEGR
eukprot:4882282-Lingulodinium_polyedra.AAC.1